MEFKKAVKTKQWLRLAIDGISGSGKTMSALRIGSGMALAIKGKIALIDSEHGSASLYADRFEFDTLELHQFQIEDYIGALEAAKNAGYEIVIIDSTSHAWDALVERVERIANQKFNGNTFRGWAEGTPLQKKLIEAMLSYPGHVIVTCRSKTEYSVEKDDKGKTNIKKVGTAAVQRQGFEYEFTMAMTIDGNHVGLFTKDRTGKFQDKFFEKPDEKIGQQLIEWLNEGSELPPVSKPVVGKQPKPTDQLLKDTLAEIGTIILTKDELEMQIFTDEEVDEVRNHLRAELAKIPADKPGEKLALASNLLNAQKEKLRQKLEAPTLASASETAQSAGTMTAQDGQTTTEETPETDDDFVDDIPWSDDKEKAGAKIPAEAELGV